MINYVIALLMFCGLTTPAYGEYYKYQDANGNVIFTDNPSNIPEDRRYEMKTVMEPKRYKEAVAENDLRREVKCSKCGRVFTIGVLLEDRWEKQNKETVAENDLPDRRKVKCPKCGAALFTIDEGLEDQWKKQNEETNKRFMEYMKKECNAKETGQAAPYTPEALNKIEGVVKEYPPQTPSVPVAPIDRHRAKTEYFREVFRCAGYDWDATIRAVANDLKNKTNKIPLARQNPDEEPSSTNSENVASMVIILMSYMKSHCEYDHVNCLDLFDSQTSEAIKWLWGSTGSRP